MGTIIEFPAQAARRPSAVLTSTPREGMGTILILPVVRIERDVTTTTKDDRGPREGAAPTRRRRRR